MKHYQVKWNDGKQIRFGRVRGDYDELAKKHAPNLIVDDAVLPIYNVVSEAAVTDIPPKFGFLNHVTGAMEGGDEFQQYCSDVYLKLKAKADTVIGVSPGAMFSLGVADGMVFYLVTEIKGKKAKVEIRHFGGDDYVDHHFGNGGWFTVKSIEPYVRRNQALNKIFSKKS